MRKLRCSKLREHLPLVLDIVTYKILLETLHRLFAKVRYEWTTTLLDFAWLGAVEFG
jgi:hypothetical protein